MREVMEALLAGKTVRGIVPGAQGIHLVNGRLVYAEECGHTLAGLHSSYEYEIVEIPNPYPAGTFFWAREEAKRGNVVRCPSLRKRIIDFTRNSFESAEWPTGALDLTDWVVVK